MSSDDNRRTDRDLSPVVLSRSNARRAETALVAANDGLLAAGAVVQSGMTLVSGLSCNWQDGMPVSIPQSRSRTAQLIAKRAIDIVVASLALLALLPLLVGVAIAIHLTDGGPVFFLQRRTGLHGRPFWIFKFRTMYAGRGDVSGVQQAVARDPRIMPIGAILRRTSIDELPQLLNIIVGDMSLVGPRPHVPAQLAAARPYVELVPYYDQRHQMLPGLTGWAQANGFRGPTEDPIKARARIDHDLAYVQNFSLLLDLKIIIKTLQREFLTGSGL